MKTPRTARAVAVLVMASILAACGAEATPPPSLAEPRSGAPPASADQSPSGSPSSMPSEAPGFALELHDIAAVIADEPLVLRTAPGIGDDSAVLETRLYPGMTVRVLEGPASASGYEWYRVAAGSVEGWAAAGRLVGSVHEPWLGWVSNGKIAFGGDAERLDGIPQVFTVDADGEHQRQLTHLTLDDLTVTAARSKGNVLAVSCGTSVDPMHWSPLYGRLAFAVGSCAKSVHIINADGTQQRRVTDGLSVAWSLDGQRLAGNPNVPIMMRPCSNEGPWDLWVHAVRTGTTTTVTHSDRCIATSQPRWSPDGRSLAFGVTDASIFDGTSAAIWIVDLVSGRERRVTTGSQPRWSPDGARLLVQRNLDSNGSDPGCGECTGLVVSVALDGSDEIDYGRGYGAAWSPGGDYVAFHRPSAMPEAQEIVVVRADGSGEQVLPGSGVFRGWAPDGRQVLVSHDFELWRLPLDGGAPVLLSSDVSGGVAWQPLLAPMSGGI